MLLYGGLAPFMLMPKKEEFILCTEDPDAPTIAGLLIIGVADAEYICDAISGAARAIATISNATFHNLARI